MRVTKEIEYTLTLTQEEADWLKGVMQNPLHGDLSEEDDDDRNMRGNFWEELNSL